MANKLDLMDIKQLLTLHIDGMSNRKIASSLGISRNTINNYVRTIKACGYSGDELLNMEDHSLHELFSTKSSVNAERYKELTAYFEQINKGLKEPGFTFLHHFEVYKQEASQPYSYTQFMEHYHRKHAREKGSMKLEHEAGYELFIDFAGDRLSITDRETGEVKDVEVFVAILPSSQYTYVEACPTQSRKDLIRCITNALKFYDGVPKAIVTDNLKSAVTRACKYEPKINRSLKDMATHYGCVINPTRTYSPQDKALVEHAVKLTYQRIYYPLRNMTFFSVEQLNQAIRKELEKYNAKLLSIKQVSRYELFHSIEKSHLKPLPSAPYEYKEYCRAKVQKMGYVLFSPDKNYYSVPYRYIGESTQIHYTHSTVEIYHKHQRIATHKRNPATGRYITIKEHLTSYNQAYKDWSPDFFREWAASHGEHVVRCVEQIFSSTEYPEIGYKRCIGIINLHKSYGSDRLNKACRMILQAESCSYYRIKNILKNNMDQNKWEDPDPYNEKSHIPPHDNTRGADAYQ